MDKVTDCLPYFLDRLEINFLSSNAPVLITILSAPISKTLFASSSVLIQPPTEIGTNSFLKKF